MGIATRDCWTEIWDVLRPLIDTPFNGGPATWIEDFELDLQRHGFVEECHFTVGYSPVPDETAPNGIGGVLATVHEITEKVIGERRVGILRDLGARVAAEPHRRRSLRVRHRHPRAAPQGRAVRHALSIRCGGPAAEAGVPHRHRRRARRTRTHRSHGSSCEVRWPLAAALRSRDHADARAGSRACRPSPSASSTHVPRTVAVVPIKSNIARKPAGALVVGISPRIRLDKLYAEFPRTGRRRRSPPPWPMRAPMKKSAAAPRRWRKSIAPRPPSSRTSATSSARR